MSEEEDQLRNLIGVLTEALRMGFTTSSSPTGPLLDLMVDLALRLSESLKEPTRVKNNPNLKMDGSIDELNNPRMLWIKSSKVFPSNLQASFFFRRLAEVCILLKGQPLWNPFRGFRGIAPSAGKQTPGSYHFFRRQRRKRTGNH